MVVGEKNEKMKVRNGEAVVEESDEVTLLGTTSDTKLSFKTHVQSLSRTSS